MIVCPYDEDQLLLILQIDHSRIVGLMAAHWGNDVFARLNPYSSMVLAAQEHDSGWWEWEIKPTLNKEGYPLDYIGSVGALGPVWLDFYRGAVQRIVSRDQYAAYFVSMHGDGLATKGMGLLPYMPDWSAVDPKAKEFVDEQHELRDVLLGELRAQKGLADVTTDEHLWTNYKYMEVFDQLGQFICNRYPFNSTVRQNGPTKNMSDVPVPVAPGADDTHILVDVQDEWNAVVKPYPFDVDPLVIPFQGRLVPNRVYESDEEFLPHFYSGERITWTYTLHADA